MDYATQQDMTDRFGEDELIRLTDRTNTGAVDATVLGQALADANAKVDLYLARYNPPLVSLPPALTTIACDIARYYLYDDAPIEAVTARYTDALSDLQAIAAGKIDLGLSDGTPVSTGQPQTDAPERVWTRDTLADF